MKRLVMLTVLLAFVLGMAANAAAVELKASGDWRIEMLYTDNFDLLAADDTNVNGDREDDLGIFQRARTTFEFIANETLKGVLQTEIGTTAWGNGAFQVGTSAAGIEVRQAYIDFNWPETDVNIKAGYFSTALPSAVGASMIHSEETAGLQISVPIIDELGLLLGYSRAVDNGDTPEGHVDELQNLGHDEFDLFYTALPITLDGVTAIPWYAYGYAGTTSVNTLGAAAAGGLIAPNATLTESRGMHFAGLALTMDLLDPFVIGFDVNYGFVNAAENNDAGATNPREGSQERAGWAVDLSVEYTGISEYVTPELFFAWTSGEDGNSTSGDAGSERLPSIVGDWDVGSFWFGGDWGMNGAMGDDINQSGFWTLGLSFKDISFLEGLSHTFTVMYVQGTNDKDFILDAAAPNAVFGRTLTEDDAIWELDLNTSYQIYEELTANLQLGWIINCYDEDLWQAAIARNGNLNDLNGNALNANADLDDADALKLSFGLRYDF